MTEFEAASLLATHVQAGVALLVGLVQCVLIAYGLRMMQRSNADRAEQNQLLFNKMDKQHEENLLALRTLIERTAQR